MKKIISVIALALCLTFGAFAQDAIDLARQQQELNSVLRKILDAKPTKEAKKEAKRLKKEGWQVPVGERSIEQQITTSLLLGTEMALDENGNMIHRFIQHTALATAGTYNAAYAAARSNALNEIASMIETELVSVVETKLDNAQATSESATTIDKLHQRLRSIVNQSLTNSIPVVTIYRVLPNKNYEVQVRLAFDRNEVSARIKRQMQQELEEEGDELNQYVDEAFSKLP